MILLTNSELEEKTAEDLMFDFISGLSKNLGRDGADARLIMHNLSKKTGIEYDYPKCDHCGKFYTSLYRRFDGYLICEDARNCFRETVLDDCVDGVVINVRQYQRNTIFSYWDSRGTPMTVEEYKETCSPMIYAKVSNNELDEDLFEGKINEIVTSLGGNNEQN